MIEKFANNNDLIKECLSGNEKAFEKLYHDCYMITIKICNRYARDFEEAKDIFHNVYMKIVKNLNSVNQDKSFTSWMKKIAVNESINYYNRINKGNKVNYEENFINYENEFILTEDESIFDKFNVDELLKMVNDLPDSYRIIFNLFAIEGYSHKEIAEKLNIKVGTSKSNLSRARVILAEKVSKFLKREQENVE